MTTLLILLQVAGVALAKVGAALGSAIVVLGASYGIAKIKVYGSQKLHLYD